MQRAADPSPRESSESGYVSVFGGGGDGGLFIDRVTGPQRTTTGTQMPPLAANSSITEKRA